MVYIQIMFGQLFCNFIKMIYWLPDYILRELGKSKVSSYLQSDCEADQIFGYLPTTVWTLAVKYSFGDYLEHWKIIQT